MTLTSHSHARPIPNKHLMESVQAALSQGFTGIIKIDYLLGEELTVLALNGDVFELLLRDKDTQQHLPGEKLWNLFEPSRMGFLTAQQAPSICLSMERACFDSQMHEVQKNVPTSQLDQLFLQYKGREAATLMLLRWNSAWAYVLIPGSNILIRHIVFFHDSQIDVDDVSAESLFSWTESHCDVTTYQGSLESGSWINIYLGILFEYICSYMLNEYSFLTGRAMINTMLRSMTFFAQKNNLELVGSGIHVQLQTLSASTSDVVTAYRILLAYLEGQMKLMVGSSIVATIKNMSRNSLNPFYLSLFKYYDF